MSEKSPTPWATSSERIAADLADRIQRGVLKSGEKLASENQLAQHYGVSRGTLRQALSYLRQRSLVKSRPGVGSFIAYHGASLDKPEGWTTATAEAGAPTTTEVVRVERVARPGDLAELFDEHATFQRILRRRLSAGAPISLEEAYLPSNEMLDLILARGLLGSSLSTTMRAAGMVPVRGEQDVRVRPLPRKCAALLDAEPGALFLYSSRRSFDEGGMLVELVNSYLNPDQFTLHVSFGK